MFFWKFVIIFSAMPSCSVERPSNDSFRLQLTFSIMSDAVVVAKISLKSVIGTL